MRRKSLEDKIREAGLKTLDKEYRESSQLMDKVISFKKNAALPKEKKTKKTPPQKKNRPSDRVTERASDRPTTRPSNRATERPSDREGDQVTDRPSDRESDRVTERASDREGDFLIYINSGINELRYAVNISKKPDDLTIRQYCVLHYIYFNRPFKVESNDGLGKIKNMGSNNAKNQVHSLYKKGYINKPYSINDGVNKGSTCMVIEKMCYPLFGTTNIINPERISPGSSNALSDRVTDRPSDRVSGRQTEWSGDRQTDRQRALNSSSSLLNKTTTMNYSDSEIEKNLNHPELIYWKEKKLKSRHIQKWMEEFSLPLDDILESLKHCRFDIVENEIKLIKTPFDFFYGRLKKAGFYHAPKGYMRHEQILINRETERLEKTKEEAEKLKRIRQEREKAKIDLEFEKMMEGKGARFKECESKLNNFEKKRRNTRTYINSMRARFEDLYEGGHVKDK